MLRYIHYSPQHTVKVYSTEHITIRAELNVLSKFVQIKKCITEKKELPNCAQCATIVTLLRKCIIKDVY